MEPMSIYTRLLLIHGCWSRSRLRLRLITAHVATALRLNLLLRLPIHPNTDYFGGWPLIRLAEWYLRLRSDTTYRSSAACSLTVKISYLSVTSSNTAIEASIVRHINGSEEKQWRLSCCTLKCQLYAQHISRQRVVCQFACSIHVKLVVCEIDCRKTGNRMEFTGCHLFNYFDVDSNGVIDSYEMKTRFEELAGEGGTWN